MLIYVHLGGFPLSSLVFDEAFLFNARDEYFMCREGFDIDSERLIVACVRFEYVATP